MKKISFALVGAAALALAACGGQQEEAAQNVDENLATENLEAMANETVNEAEALENQAEALEEAANATSVAADEADADAANVNAM